MSQHIRGALGAVFLLMSTTVLGAERFDVSNAAAYESTHRSLISTLLRSISNESQRTNAMAQLRASTGEVALTQICSDCTRVANNLMDSAEYEPSVWLYEPQGPNSLGDADVLIAFPPVGEDREFPSVDAVSLDGRWLKLDGRMPPTVPVIVVRVNGRLSWARQVASANALLKQAGIQSLPALQSLQRQSQPMAAAGTGYWTTRLESIRLNDDEEPWISGDAEVYAVTSGVLPGNQAQVQIVDMPYLNDDGVTYSPRQIILDWQDYSFGVANIQLFEHDDGLNYRDLVAAIIAAIGGAGSLAGFPEITAVIEIANRILTAMPDSWLTNDDDYVDSLYTIEKTRGETNRAGAAGNAVVTYIPYELPPN